MKTVLKLSAISMAIMLMMSSLIGCNNNDNPSSSSSRPGFPDYIKTDTADNFKYDLYKTYAVITEYTGNDKDVKIPDELEGVAVTKINERAFTNDKNKDIIHSIYIPTSVTDIDTVAFYNSQYLEEFKISSDNKNFNVKDGVLYAGDKKSIVAYPENKKDEEFTIPEGITTINNSQFAFCNNLKKVNLPSTLKIVGDYAFLSANQIKEITIPEGVEKLGYCTFFKCNSLEKVSLPSTLKSIDQTSFVGCSKLTNLSGYDNTSVKKVASELKIEYTSLG